MRGFLLKLILFILPVIIFCVFAEVKLRSIDNDYKYKNEWLGKNASKVKLLTLGSSHTYFGINPEEFSVPAFNLAHVSQDLTFDYFLFEKYLPLEE